MDVHIFDETAGKISKKGDVRASSELLLCGRSTTTQKKVPTKYKGFTLCRGMLLNVIPLMSVLILIGVNPLKNVQTEIDVFSEKNYNSCGTDFS